MTKEEVLKEMQGLASEQIRKIYLNHGAGDSCMGVKTGDLKGLVKKIKKDHALSISLFDTGIYEAIYLAGLIADEKKISKKELEGWAEKAKSPMVSEYTVSWIAAESPYGWELANEWIESTKDHICSAGWATLSSLVSIQEDSRLNTEALRKLLMNIPDRIDKAGNRSRYTMNGFIIACGSYVPTLKDDALKCAKKVGKVEVMAGNTACKVPDAKSYIDKVWARGPLKKKKQARCL